MTRIDFYLTVDLANAKIAKLMFFFRSYRFSEVNTTGFVDKMS